jgi:hypothetical protein
VEHPLLVGIGQGVGGLQSNPCYATKIEVSSSPPELLSQHTHRRRNHRRPDVGIAGCFSQTLDILQHAVQRLTPNELHGVVVRLCIFAHGKDRHDVRVVQLGRGAGLASKPFQLIGPHGRLYGEYLEGHVPAQRFLDRLVHDAHATVSHFAEHTVFAQLTWQTEAGACKLGAVLFLTSRRSHFLHRPQSRKQLLDLAGQMRVPCGVFRQRRRLAAAQALGILVS